MMNDLKRKKPVRDTRAYAFNCYMRIQERANATNMHNEPSIKRALLMIKRFPNNRAVVEKHFKDAMRYLKPKLKVEKEFPNNFKPNPVDREVDGDLKIGNVRHAGVDFGLNLEELVQHLLITGRAGAGKTTLIYIILLQLLEYGIPFWTFDFKEDYRHIVKADPNSEVFVFNWETFRFNPLRPPPGVPAKIWIQAFSNVFCQAYWLLDASQGVINEHVAELYEEYGVFSGSNVYPTMFDLHELLKKHWVEKKYGFRGRNYMESSLNRTGKCALDLEDILNCDKGFPVEELLDKNVVLELEGLNTNSQSFLVSIILRYVFQYRISNNQRSGLKHVFLFDEAKTVYDRQREFSKELGRSEISQFTSKIREFGEGLVVSDQMPVQLADSIKANVYTVICMSQSGSPNILNMAQALGLTGEQIEDCRQLQSDKNKGLFEAIVRMNGKWTTPFVVQVKRYHVNKDVTSADLQLIIAPLFQELNQHVIPRTEYGNILREKRKEEQQQKDEEIKARQKETAKKEKVEGNILIKILTNIREHPFIDQKTRVQMLGLASSSSTNDKYFKELLARGFMLRVPIGLGKGQSTKVLYEITDKGREFARMDKFVIPGKGSLEHKFWQHKIKDFYESLDYKAEIEKRYGFKNVDVGVEMNGEKIAVEVDLTPKNLMENIQKDFIAGCDKVIVVARTKRSINAYQKTVQRYGKDYLDRIQFMTLTDFLS